MGPWLYMIGEDDMSSVLKGNFEVKNTVASGARDEETAGRQVRARGAEPPGRLDRFRVQETRQVGCRKLGSAETEGHNRETEWYDYTRNH